MDRMQASCQPGLEKQADEQNLRLRDRGRRYAQPAASSPTASPTPSPTSPSSSSSKPAWTSAPTTSSPTPGLNAKLLGNPILPLEFLSTVPRPELSGREAVHPRGKVLVGADLSLSRGIGFMGECLLKGRGKGNGLPVVNPPHANGGSHGPIQASLPQWGNVLGSAWLEACRSLGLENLKDPLEGEAVGGYISTCRVTGTTRERSHTGVAYLNEETLGRENLKVETGVLVDKIEFDKTEGSNEATATGVTYWQDNSLHNAQVRKEVLLAAGVFGSPAILERSGIGSRTLLSKYNIPIIHPNDHVGENLQDHIRVGLSFEATPDCNPEEPLTDDEARKSYATHRSGPWANNTCSTFAHFPLLPFLTHLASKPQSTTISLQPPTRA
ncbi:unnamed protein product [Zymoseptoria tritici ST99CH_1E4]|uniref:Glucose-methanol-choline oxidoreductase N-terminal domain-containing protein n=1 Tax=Zymoseptoria tritici ST99CH_1E4 TaxID=1276532 RepID=A0A2H1GHL7_ZYMTR|nr:unnamed protein product [Zymoseptoria tritici ST99CH_1E4]